MAKAIRLFGTLRPVDSHERLLASDVVDRIVAACDVELAPCSRDESTTLVAELLGAYPGLRAAAMSAEAQRDFKLYCIKLQEAFLRFSFPIGKAIVNGGTGVPARQKFKPQPSDIVAMGEAEERKRHDLKAMALRHRTEAERRERARAAEVEFERSRGTPEHRAQVVARLLPLLRETAA